MLLVTGIGALGPFALPPDVDVLTIPGLQKVSNGEYVARRLALSPCDTADLRAGLLEAAVRSFRPSVLLADKHPVGPAGELVPALLQLRSQGGLAVLGLRDVLDDPAAVEIEWRCGGLVEAFDRFYAHALVYGSADLLDPVAEAGLPPAVLARASWVATSSPPARTWQRRLIWVATAGRWSSLASAAGTTALACCARSSQAVGTPSGTRSW